MTLTDACALVPTLKIVADNSIFAAKAIAKLADWATRFTPWVAINGTDGLWLDITGCSDLFGGEGALLDRLRQGLARFNITAHVAVADTAGAAWAMTHFTTNDGIPPSKNRASLTPLPVAALRLEASIVKNLELMGLSHIGDLLSLPRASLSERFGDKLLVRLDQALGVIPEPISPRRPTSTFIVRHAYTEPVTVVASIAHTLDHLLLKLCRLLKKRRRGVRQAVLSLFQANDTVQRIAIGTNRKVQEPKPLAALFTEHLKSFSFCLKDGSGIEIVMLAATVTEHLEPTQLPLKATEAHSRSSDNNHMLVDLVDRLTNRLAGGTVARFTPHQSHVPERAVQICTSITQHLSASWPINLPRPIHLFTPPIPIEAVAMIPDNPPILFRWQKRTHRVANASGPERIMGEWWRGDRWTRDYYQIEDMAGARFWLYREGLYRDTVNPRWWLHGLFA
ncbi:MAG: hypothetical protein CFH37_01404 [Alphaproteobacteria bacterium MarineAlpha9_Bin7]|nr:MAG: hypothetical protein CFH37_01404 [Alphaproteobacteria bacterium MarineAlpha9_Bin7]